MPDQAADALFDFVPLDHYLMPAAYTLKPKVSTGSKYAPLFTAARMRLFHNQYIPKSDFHSNLLAYWPEVFRMMI